MFGNVLNHEIDEVHYPLMFSPVLLEVHEKCVGGCLSVCFCKTVSLQTNNLDDGCMGSLDILKSIVYTM